MKKKLLAMLACAVLVIQLAAPATAAGMVYFTAVNMSVLELSDATMPFWSNGYLYVAGSVFSSYSKELGVSYSYNAAKEKVVLYVNGDILAALQDFVDRLCTNVGGNAAILMFLVLLGTLVALMIRAGGSKAYGEWAVKHIKTKSGAVGHLHPGHRAGRGRLLQQPDHRQRDAPRGRQPPHFPCQAVLHVRRHPPPLSAS